MYIVTARKYRPQIFADLVGQSHVSETLHNALTLDRVAQAYLFCGSRGVGKTTAARILAKAVNCTTPLSEREKGEPCRKCESCTSFEEGRSLNIIEIDAASNNGVEDVRALREKVAIPPQGALKKVYIIDEVHMLSNAAFNALLKTLEEPPPHALFIFATTEPHKVLATIISRCQRFDFRRITVADMAKRLAEIAQKEQITADEESLLLIARRADGALRDALSTFDQAVALCGTTLQYADLVQALGVIAMELFFDVTDAIRNRNQAQAFDIVHQLTRTGNDYQEFLGGLSEHIRNLMLVQALGNASLIEASELNQKRYEAEAVHFQNLDLLRMLALVSETEQNLRLAPQPRLRLELLLLKMVALPSAVDIGKLLDKIEQMEKGGGFSVPPTPSSPQTPVVPTLAEPEIPLNTLLGKSTQEAPKQQTIKSKVERIEESDKLTKNPAPPIPTQQPELKKSDEAQALFGGTSSTLATHVLGKPALSKTKQASAGDGTTHTPFEQVAVSPVLRSDDVEDLKRAWVQSIAYFQENGRKMLVSLLSNSALKGWRGELLQIEAIDVFNADMLRENEGEIRQILQKYHQAPLPIFEIVFQETPESHLPEEDPTDPFTHLNRLRQSDPIIQKLIDQFGGEPIY